MNFSKYNDICKSIRALCIEYNIDEGFEMVYYDDIFDLKSINTRISKLLAKFKNEIQYHYYIIKYMLCFLECPISFDDKETLWKRIICNIKEFNIKDPYDIIQKYTHNLMSSSDIIYIFGADIKKIIQYVMGLKNDKKIMEILIGLYDNDNVRVIFENDDINKIIFNNYNKINIEELERCYFIDNSIKNVFKILSTPTKMSKKNNTMNIKISDEDVPLLAKYLFTYSSPTYIKKIVKLYQIKICDIHIEYYSSNKSFDIIIFKWLIENGAKPDSKSILQALKPYIKGARCKNLFNIIENSLIDNKNATIL